MKPAINQWAFPASMPATEAISLAKRLGFEAFEVCVGVDGPTRLDATDGEIAAIRRHAEKEGMSLHSVGCGAGWQYMLTSPDPANRARAAEVTTRGLEVAGALGADALLVVPGVVDGATSYDVALENAEAGIRALIPAAERTGVAVAIENVWNRFLLSPTEMRDFIDQFGSPHVGAYFDVGNVLLYGLPEQWIRILGKRIRAIHMKDFRVSVGGFGGFVMLMEGDANWPAVMAALREIGYDKALTAEFGPYAHSLEAMLRHVLVSLKAIAAL